MICKIWGIKARKNNIKKGVADSIRYVKDEEKTNVVDVEFPFFDEDVFADEIDIINNDNDLNSVINYMKNEHKTKKVYVSGYLCDPEKATDEFYITKEKNLDRVGKTLEDEANKNQAFHIVQSFPDDLDISDNEVHQCGIELCKKLEKYQAVITSHLHPVYDEHGVLRGKCKHNHILINSHMNPEFIDPSRPNVIHYNDCKESYAQLRDWNDEIAIAHGFPVILNQENDKIYSWFETEKNNEGKSWKQRVRLDIENNMQLATSWPEFKELMRKAHYTIQEGKYETYTTPEQQKVRGKTLGDEYTKEYLENYWEFKRNLYSSIEKEMEENNSVTISFENLNELYKNSLDAYFVKIPRTNKHTGEKYDFHFPLKKPKTESVINTYIKEENTYSLYKGKNICVGTVSGTVIKDVLLEKGHNTYEQLKKWEEMENEKREREDLNRILKEQQEQQQYSRNGWNNSKTGQPYRIGMYNDDGNKRTLLEQILILAVVVITNEAPEYAIPERERLRIEKTNARLALIIQKPSWKAERILEAIKYAKEENIQDLNQLKERLDEAGKEMKKNKAQQRKNFEVREKMEPIHIALTTVEKLEDLCETIFAMPEGFEKVKLLAEQEKNIEDYKIAKATLYHHGIDSAEKRADFKDRYEYNINREKQLTMEYEFHSKSYSKLKKIKYQIDLAMNKDYCYGTDESREKTQQKAPENQSTEK